MPIRALPMSVAAATAPPRAARIAPRRVRRRPALRPIAFLPARAASSRRAVTAPPPPSGASFAGDDGALLRALRRRPRVRAEGEPEAIAAAAASPDAVLLPLSGTKVFPEHPNTEPSSGESASASASASSHVRWRPAEALVRDVPEDALDRGALSFLGFRARDGAAVFCADVASAPATEAAVRSAVRRREKKGDDDDVHVADAKSVGPSMRRADAGLLAAAAGLARWQRSVRFCSECGSRTALVKAGHKAQCVDETNVKCRGSFYPKLMPAVLTLCTCGEYALLARNAAWPRGFYSCLAGFVDQSESLEQAVAREVLEESGIRIDDKRTSYVASQPWPFPCQLMVGFRAEASAKTVALRRTRDETKKTKRESVFSYPPTPNLDIHELRDARWFHREWLREELGKNLGDPREGGGEIPLGSVAVPGAHALARHMLERWVREGSGSGSVLDGGAAKESDDRFRFRFRLRFDPRGGTRGRRPRAAPSGHQPVARVRVRGLCRRGRGNAHGAAHAAHRGWRRAHRERSRASARGRRARGGEARGETVCFFSRKRKQKHRHEQERVFPRAGRRAAVFPRRRGFGKCRVRRRARAVFDDCVEKRGRRRSRRRFRRGRAVGGGRGAAPPRLPHARRARSREGGCLGGVSVLTHVGTFAERKRHGESQVKVPFRPRGHTLPFIGVATRRAETFPTNLINGGEEIAPRDDASFIGFVNPRKIHRARV